MEISLLSPGLFSDKRAVIALVIGIPLAIIALVFVKPYDYTMSLVVFGVSLILIVFACILDTADEFQTVPKVKPIPDETVLPESNTTHAEEYIPAVEKPAAAPEDLPVETIEGIGKVYGKLLRDAGISTIAELLGEDPKRIAVICDVNVEQANRWIAMSRFSWLDTISEEDAEAIVFATGMEDLESLAAANAEELYKKIEAALTEGDVRVPAGYTFSVEKIQKWIDEAKSLV